MITARQAYDILKKKYPAKKSTIGVFHDGYYIFTLLDPEELKTGSIDCLYAVNPKNGQIGKYSIAGDEERFFDELERHPIKFADMVETEY